MARTKEFDETVVLEQALELFRARGFAHTSFSDLTSTLGISRQSLYDTYGDKQTLFETALKRYMDRGIDAIRRTVEDPAPVREVLIRFFDLLIDGSCGNGSHGCLLVNSMVELAPLDANTRAFAHQHARAVEQVLISRLTAAQREGEIATHKDPVVLAHFFYHTLLGMAVAARALGERDTLRHSARMAIRCLD